MFSLPPKTGWTHLPYPPPVGTKNKRNLCAGCLQPLCNGSSTVLCTFRLRGFGNLRPCQTGYHTRCISVGAPFASRRKHGMGLSFPNISVWPNFVCEACTVRQILKRELIGRSDGLLMALERIRLIDMAWSWSKKPTARTKANSV